MLAAAATAGASETSQDQNSKLQIENESANDDAGKLIGSLQIGKNPTFEKALPCYAR